MSPLPLFLDESIGPMQAGHHVAREHQKQKDAMLFIPVPGKDLMDLGIFQGDLMLVEKKPPAEGDVVVAMIDQELVARRFIDNAEGAYLFSEDPAEALIQFDPDLGHVLIGVVTKIIQALPCQ